MMISATMLPNPAQTHKTRQVVLGNMDTRTLQPGSFKLPLGRFCVCQRTGSVETPITFASDSMTIVVRSLAIE